ncbi:hypothetical protein RHMOL_Rhmol11G0112100 [Rhododendron molle]|uniref:Uncharacterized protein n=1 Tax=Rhododendron molle TaxID=49168 RepID=A0ACC0LQW7_RHOML|nr:hypothetical protein RHMOL_Rhmol11G0112100 [Rhododendron molle]
MQHTTSLSLTSSFKSRHPADRKEENMGKRLYALLGRKTKAPKLKTLASLAMARIPILKNLHTVRCSHARSDVVQLHNLGYPDRALLRVELVIREQNMLDVLVMVEKYCHLLIEGLLLVENNRECPEELNETISSLIFAASRCRELPELQEIRMIFSSTYGNEFEKQDMNEKEEQLKPREAAKLNDTEAGVYVYEKGGLERSFSSSSWNTEAEDLYDVNLTAYDLDRTASPSDEEIDLDQSDEETGKNQNSMPWLEEHHDPGSDKSFSDTKGYKPHSKADLTTCSVEGRSGLGNTHYLKDIERLEQGIFLYFTDFLPLSQDCFEGLFWLKVLEVVYSNHKPHQTLLRFAFLFFLITDKVELVIREQNMLDVLDIVEKYCHLPIEGFLIVENNRECPEELNEAISSLIFAASRCRELPELQEIRMIFSSR